MLNLSMVAVPVWLDQALKATRTSERQILDVEAMSRITSRDDVAFYAICNNEIGVFLEGLHPALIALCNTLRSYPLLNPESWTNVKADNDGLYPTQEEYMKSLQRIRDRVDIRMYSYGDNPEQNTRASLLKELVPALTYPFEGAESKNDINILPMVFYIRDNVYGVRFMQANPKYDYIVQLHRSISEVLEILCAHHPFSEVAKLPIFAAFVDICRSLPGFTLT